jgi:hypothetical protein
VDGLEGQLAPAELGLGEDPVGEPFHQVGDLFGVGRPGQAEGFSHLLDLDPEVEDPGAEGGEEPVAHGVVPPGRLPEDLFPKQGRLPLGPKLGGGGREQDEEPALEKMGGYGVFHGGRLTLV